MLSKLAYISRSNMLWGIGYCTKVFQLRLAMVVGRDKTDGREYSTPVMILKGVLKGGCWYITGSPMRPKSGGRSTIFTES